MTSHNTNAFSDLIHRPDPIHRAHSSVSNEKLSGHKRPFLAGRKVLIPSMRKSRIDDLTEVKRMGIPTKPLEDKKHPRRVESGMRSKRLTLKSTVSERPWENADRKLQ